MSCSSFSRATRIFVCTLLLTLATVLGSTALAAGKNSAPAAKLKLSPATKSIAVGSDSTDQSFLIRPSLSGSAVAKIAGTWKSSNKKVARVDSTGKVTPVGRGTATIQFTTVASGKKQTAKCKVTVKPIVPTSVSLSIPRASLYVGNTMDLGVSVKPANAYNKAVAFRSSNTSVATVSSKGVVKAKKAGKATIYVRTKAGKRVDSVKINVSPNLSGGKYRLIAVGQGNYMGDFKLPGCIKDVDMIANAFKNASYSGKKASVHKYTNLSGKQLRNLLRDMGTMDATASDTTIFYYSGHGMSGGGMNGALCGVDWDLITVNEVQRYLDRVPGKIIVMLDSCLSGQYITSSKSLSAAEIAISAKSAAAFNAAFVAAFEKNIKAKALTDSSYRSKYKIITAAAPKQAAYISYERRDGCSVFSDYASQGMGSDYANGKIPLMADGSSDGIVTVAELYNYINKKVISYVKRYPSYKQTTMVWPKNDKTVVIARN